MPRIVGIMLVKNEDIFVKAALANILEFCDEVIVLDNFSSDDTVQKIASLRDIHSHIRFEQVADAHDTQRFASPYANTDTFMFGVDGDEIYDVECLARLRKRIDAGEFRDVWCLYGSVLHCVDIDFATQRARGFLTPPSRSMTKIYNFSLLRAWTEKRQRLHGRKQRFLEGKSGDTAIRLYEFETWDNSSFRCLHTCFMRRSTLALDTPVEMNTLSEETTRIWIRKNPNESVVTRDLGRGWKLEKYAVGKLATVDAKPFHLPENVEFRQEPVLEAF